MKGELPAGEAPVELILRHSEIKFVMPSPEFGRVVEAWREICTFAGNCRREVSKLDREPVGPAAWLALLFFWGPRMNVLERSPRVEIAIPVNPEFELRLDRVSIQENGPTAADFEDNRLDIGHAWFSIFGEVWEITTVALLFVEYPGGGGGWLFEPLAEAMGKLVMAEGGE
jgi:hypothetical protein